jgi:hypothetical protein
VTESGSPTSHDNRSSSISSAPSSSSETPVDKPRVGAFPEYDESEDGDNDEDDGGFGDDFDDFEEGGEDAEFGDFDGGFQEAEAAPIPAAQSLPTITPSFVSAHKSPQIAMQL